MKFIDHITLQNRMLVNDELKKYERKELWFISRNYASICKRSMIAQSLKWQAMGCMTGVQFPSGSGTFLFAPFPDQLWWIPSFLSNEYWGVIHNSVSKHGENRHQQLFGGLRETTVGFTHDSQSLGWYRNLGLLKHEARMLTTVTKCLITGDQDLISHNTSIL